MTLVWSRTFGENSCTQRNCRESDIQLELNFSRNSKPDIVLISYMTHMATPLYPRNVSLPLVKACTKVFLPWVSHPCISFSGSYFVDFIYDQMYLSATSARFIVGQCNILHNTWVFVSLKASIASQIFSAMWRLSIPPKLNLEIQTIRNEFREPTEFTDK